MLASRKLSGHSAKFEVYLQPDHILMTSAHFEMGVGITKAMSEGLIEEQEEQQDCECLLKTKCQSCI
jgi:hypothetical protein